MFTFKQVEIQSLVVVTDMIQGEITYLTQKE
jgi:hypothetical protein